MLNIKVIVELLHAAWLHNPSPVLSRLRNSVQNSLALLYYLKKTWLNITNCPFLLHTKSRFHETLVLRLTERHCWIEVVFCLTRM